MSLAGPIARTARICQGINLWRLSSIEKDTRLRSNQNQLLRTFSKRGGGGEKVGRNKGNNRKNNPNLQQNQRHNKNSPRQVRRGKTVEPIATQSLPPSMLAPTGSPFVYVARPALVDDDGSMVLDPSTLFSESEMPSTFTTSTFEFVSPNDLKHELPKHKVPEVAFLGRSNVGKSSLVNALMRKKLCLTSKSPGRTQQAYYYGLFPTKTFNSNNIRDNLNRCLGFLIDLPGYGYAKAPDEEVGEWQSNTQDILLNRRDEGVLQRLFLLVDSRRGPMQIDRNVMGWLDEAEIPYSVVLTKADRVAVPQVVKEVNSLCIRYASEKQNLEETEIEENDDNNYDLIVPQSPVTHVTSSKQNMGIQELMLSVETEFCDHDD